MESSFWMLAMQQHSPEEETFKFLSILQQKKLTSGTHTQELLKCERKCQEQVTVKERGFFLARFKFFENANKASLKKKSVRNAQKANSIKNHLF